MREDTKVKFTLGIGYVNAVHEDMFTLGELGYRSEIIDTEEDLEEMLSEAWEEWSSNYIEGSWSLDGDVVNFTLSIGYVGADHIDEMTFDDLGYDPDVDSDEDLEQMANEAWEDWSSNYVDGSWEVKDK